MRGGKREEERIAKEKNQGAKGGGFQLRKRVHTRARVRYGMRID